MSRLTRAGSRERLDRFSLRGAMRPAGRPVRRSRPTEALEEVESQRSVRFDEPHIRMGSSTRRMSEEEDDDLGEGSCCSFRSHRSQRESADEGGGDSGPANGPAQPATPEARAAPPESEDLEELQQLLAMQTYQLKRKSCMPTRPNANSEGGTLAPSLARQASRGLTKESTYEQFSTQL